MSTHWGNEGLVRSGSNAVAEIDNWNFNENVSPVDDSAMGDAWKTHIPGSGMRGWQGSIECHWDETDTNGQQTLVAGASVTLSLCPEGYTTGDKYWTGLATVQERGLNVQKDGSTIRASFNFLGNGALTETTVS